MRYKLLSSKWKLKPVRNYTKQQFPMTCSYYLLGWKGQGFQGSRTAFERQRKSPSILGESAAHHQQWENGRGQGMAWCIGGSLKKHRPWSTWSGNLPEVSSWCNVKTKLRPSGYIPLGGRARGVSFNRTKRALWRCSWSKSRPWQGRLSTHGLFKSKQYRPGTSGTFLFIYLFIWSSSLSPKHFSRVYFVFIMPQGPLVLTS